MRKLLLLFFLCPSGFAFAQVKNNPASDTNNLAPLTVQKIMRDPKWIGTCPSDAFWSPNSEKIYFMWNPTKATSDSLYFVTLNNHQPQKATPDQRILAEAERDGVWNKDLSELVYIKQNGLYVLDVHSGISRLLYQTTETITNPNFSFQDKRVVFQQGNNLFAVSLQQGGLMQLTHFLEGQKPDTDKALTAQQAFLTSDALENSALLRKRKSEKEEGERNENNMPKQQLPKTIYLGKQQIATLALSPDGNYIFYELMDQPKVESPLVPDYVTQSGYTKAPEGRPAVGVPQPTFTDFIYDRQKDTVYKIDPEQIPGIRDIPQFIQQNYPKEFAADKKVNKMRPVFMSQPFWNPAGTKAFVVIRAQDHKDRWLMELNLSNGKLQLLDRQHDDAWIGGPGIGYPYEIGNVGWTDDNTLWYQSEKTGYSHLYTLNISNGQTTALTQGKYEVQTAQLSPDRKTFYITTNDVEPSQNQFYLLNIATKKQTRITQMKGGNVIAVSPDGKQLAVLYSTLIHPWELYLQPNKAGSKAVQITHKAESAQYRSYSWRVPDIITFKDRDGLAVYASVYRPKEQAETRPGVIFVHGAGYLQDVIRSWSYYFREHMFMNMLADQGYTVMDIDYRGSAGYGRDWRTDIYRHMGGNDLEDIVDGAKYMADSLNVNPNKIGVWGGSYGGFMTLMAMFKSHAFVCGAALRSVTDWAHYNHDYTSEILNLPQNDSIAYVQSSPIYFADGLQGHLLMCHGVVDPNVHFQDIVRLNQKLIELGKKNWQLAIYPLEGHDFEDAPSWTDEYRRIYQLFQNNLK